MPAILLDTCVWGGVLPALIIHLVQGAIITANPERIRIRKSG